MIPRGRVTTYGQVAVEAGMPGNARLVGYALHALPPDSGIPWQRVINARGRISFEQRTTIYKKQLRMLRKEGIRFVRGTVDLRKFGWPSSNDER